MNLRIKGELTAEEDMTLEGSFEGAIDLKGHHLTIGTQSDVKARVSARAVTVLGRLEGHVTADAIDIRPSAVVEANLIAKKFALKEGGRFNGQVNTERARAALDIARHRAQQQPAERRQEPAPTARTREPEPSNPQKPEPVEPGTR